MTRVIRTLAQSILGRDDVRPVLWKLLDDGWIEVQRLRHHVYWTVRQPIGQRYFLKPVCSEDFHVFEICIAGVLDIVTKRLFDVADIAGMKVCGDGRWSGVENGYTSGALDPIVPLIGIRMPMPV